MHSHFETDQIIERMRSPTLLLYQLVYININYKVTYYARVITGYILNLVFIAESSIPIHVGWLKGLNPYTIA